MNKGLLLLFCVLLCVAGLLYFAWSASESPAAPLERAAPVALGPERETAVLAGGPTTTIHVDPSVDRGASAAARQSAPSSDASPDASPDATWLLRVVRARGGAPAVGARVEARPIGEGALASASPADAELTATTTDARGEARLPRRPLEVVAQLDDEHGTLGYGDPKRSEATLLLQPERGLLVRATDAAGAPVANLRVRIELPREPRVMGLAPEMSSDAAGEARFPNVLSRLRGSGAPAIEIEADVLTSRRAIWRVERTALEASWARGVATGDAARERVEISLPLLGAVQLDVREADGSSAPPTWHAYVRPELPKDADEHAVLWGEDGGLGLGAPPPGLLAHVELGQRLTAIVTRSGGTAGLRHSFDGPRTPGALETVRVSFGRRGLTVVARAFDEAGAALAAGTRLSLFELEGNEVGLQSSAEVEPDGRFRFELGALPEQPQTLGFEVRESMLSGGNARHARLEFSTPGRSGTLDVGNVVFASAPLLVAGWIVGEKGEPIANAKVHLLLKVEGQDIQLSHVDGPLESGPDGAFELRGSAPRAALELRASHEQWLFDPLPVRAGESAARLVGSGAAWLHGRILLPNAARGSDSPSLMLQSAGGARRNSWNWLELAADGGFASGPLWPGRYRLRVQRGWSDTLREIDDLLAISGERRTDPRLDPLDLSALHALRVRCRAPDGAPVTSGSVTWHASGDPSSERITQQLSTVDAVLLCAQLPVDLVVECTGFATQQRLAVREDCVIELEAAPRVRIVLENPEVLPAPPFAICPMLVFEADDESRAYDDESTCFDALGQALVSARGVGRHTMRWRLEKREQQTLTTTTARTQQPIWIDVTGEPGVQEVRVRADPADWQSRLEGL